jgi:hypothetical protein
VEIPRQPLGRYTEQFFLGLEPFVAPINLNLAS